MWHLEFPEMKAEVVVVPPFSGFLKNASMLRKKYKENM